VRTLERALARLRLQDPLHGGTAAASRYLANPTELKLLHMITGDPKRTPTAVMFGNPDYWFQSGSPSCRATCVAENPSEAWNHGTINPDINTTWLGLVGPGVRHIGADGAVWSDHTDIRPTMLELLGLHDRYQDQGRVLFEVLARNALPSAVASDQQALVDLAAAYKQIQAPVGPLAMATLKISTRALASGSTASDSTYTSLEARLTRIGNERDALAGRMLNALTGAEFASTPVPASQAQALVRQADALLAQARQLASG
jgi:hypothetical protein